MPKETEKKMQADWTKEQVLKRLFEISVKAVIVNEEGKVLLLKRAKDEKTFPDIYDLPGGGLEEGETLQMALAREIMEETNLEVTIGPIVYAFDSQKNYQLQEGTLAFQSKGLRFLCFFEKGEIKLNSQEHASYEWLALDEAISKVSTEGFERDKHVALVRAKEYLQLKEGLDGWKRCLADMTNYRVRMEKEQQDFRKYCLQDLIVEILPVIDNFEMATEHIAEEDKEKAWVKGIMHIKNQLENVLASSGVQKIQIQPDEKFDPAIAEILTGQNQAGEAKIKRVIKNGYRIGEKVIRPVAVEVI